MFIYINMRCSTFRLYITRFLIGQFAPLIFFITRCRLMTFHWALWFTMSILMAAKVFRGQFLYYFIYILCLCCIISRERAPRSMGHLLPYF